MQRTVLSVAYPLTAAGPDAAGGAEQILTHVESALARSGYRSIVVACEGSRVCGDLVDTPAWEGELTDEVRGWAQRQHRIAIEKALHRYPVDLVHMHSYDWHAYLPSGDVPVLATLHLPCDWYPEGALAVKRPRTVINCVSRSQRSSCRIPRRLAVPVVENGIPIERFETNVRKRGYAVSLGRICPEKGIHIAIDAAKLADIELIIAGAVFRYEWHMRYFEEQILPRLDAKRRFRGPVGLARKRRLLAGAQCVLVPNLAAETSSLVSMEAMACGTPVIAFDSGALTEIVEDGRTGFIVHNVEEMAAAIRLVPAIDTEECRRVARERFSAERMAHDYMEVYEQMLSGAALPGALTVQTELPQ